MTMRFMLGQYNIYNKWYDHVSNSRLLSITSGCGGSPATMTGPQGTFGITETQYENRLECGWKIQVETTKVGNTKYTMSCTGVRLTCAITWCTGTPLGNQLNNV